MIGASEVRQTFEHEQWQGPEIPRFVCWELVPGIPLVLPETLKTTAGHGLSVFHTYHSLLCRYRDQFEEFLFDKLGLDRELSPGRIAEGISRFLKEVESEIDRALLPGDLRTPEGLEKVIQGILALLPGHEVLRLKEEVSQDILLRHSPEKLRSRGIRLETLRPGDVLAMAGFSEEKEYVEKIYGWVREFVRPRDFERVPISVFPVARELTGAFPSDKEAASLSRLTGRLVVSNLEEGAGGEYPKLWYLTALLSHAFELVWLADMWEYISREDPGFGQRMVNLVRQGEGRILSAFSFLANMHERRVAESLRKAARDADSRLPAVAYSYGLAMSMPDGTFIPCSARTWAEHSMKGGQGAPPPGMAQAETNWFGSDLIRELYAAKEGSARDLESRVCEIIATGNGHKDLAESLLGSPVTREVVPHSHLAWDQPPAGQLHRYPQNPILEPLPGNGWESKYVLNCGTVRLGGKVLIFYRAVGSDNISRIGLAVSPDGFEIEKRLPEPIFSPSTEAERQGCEDPRIISMEGQVHMLYTAFDGRIAQIAASSIRIEDLLEGRWTGWKKGRLVFPGTLNKDAILFPEKFGRQYVLYHRVGNSMWITRCDSLDYPWKGSDHKILLDPRSGLLWDGIKIGGGAQPIKTRFGWLLIYHGIDHRYVYRLGLFLTDLNDPGKLIYRSPNPILEPERDYEKGIPGKSWVPNVVFTCGAVPRADKEILDEHDEILVYYGASDHVIGVATATVGELIPHAIREKALRETMAPEHSGGS